MLQAGAIIKDFRAESEVNHVILYWTARAEVNIRSYEILRSSDGVDFERIGDVPPLSNDKQENTYQFHDRSVFKTSGRTYYYRLKIVDKDNQSTVHSKTISISPQISSVRQTWGSIKAMFR